MMVDSDRVNFTPHSKALDTLHEVNVDDIMHRDGYTSRIGKEVLEGYKEGCGSGFSDSGSADYRITIAYVKCAR